MNKMVEFENSLRIECGRVIHIKEWLNRHKYKCIRIATHTNGSHYFCRRHSRTGRFIARIGDVGKILARFDTEEELRLNFHQFPGARMQKLTHSHRRDLY